MQIGAVAERLHLEGVSALVIAEAGVERLVDVGHKVDNPFQRDQPLLR